MKVVIGKEIGGLWLPDSALLRLVELGMPCFIQKTEDLSGMPECSMFVWESWDNPKKERELTLFYKLREEAGCDKRIVIAIEELIKSNKNCFFSTFQTTCTDCKGQSTCERLAIIEIPDGIEWYIHENEMGVESIHEKHRIWNAPL